MADELSPTGVYPELTIFLKVVLSLASIFGTFGNILTIVSIATNKQLRTIPNAYIVNLAIADLIVCLILMPICITFYDGPPSELLCELTGYPTLICMMVSVLNLSLIALNRYIVVCKSSDLYMKIYKKRNVIISCCLAWVTIAIVVSPPFFGLGTYGYNAKFGTCLFITNDPETYWMIFAFVDCIVIFPTMFLTLFCYIKIMLKFRQSQNTMFVASQSVGPTVQSTSGQIMDEEESRSAPGKSVAKQLKEKKRNESRSKMRSVIKSLFIIWITFLFFWMPLISVYKIDYYSKVSNTVYHVLFALAQCNSTVNFILYALTNRSLREGYKRTLTCGRKGKISPM